MTKFTKISIALTTFAILLNISTRAQQNDTLQPDTVINLYKQGFSLNLNQQQLQLLPFRDVSSFGLVAPSGYYLKEGNNYYFGMQTGGNVTYVDGLQIDNPDGLPLRLISNYSLNLVSDPVEYGFYSGAVTELKTLDNFDKITLISDVNGDYTFNMQGFNGELIIGIPLSFKKPKGNKPAPYLLVSGKYKFTNNPNPVWKNPQKIKPEVLDGLIQNPLRRSEYYSGVFYNHNFVLPGDFTDQGVPENRNKSGVYPYVKLFMPVAKNAAFTFSNYSVFENSKVFDFDNTMFNYQFYPVRTTRNTDSYIKWEQNFNISDDLKFNYRLQAQYSNYFTKIADPRHGNNFFDYGYIGSFTSYKHAIFEHQDVEIDGTYYQNIPVLVSLDYDTLTVWNPGTTNPEVAAITSSYYDLCKGYPEGHYDSPESILLGGGLLNGINPATVYGLWNSAGSIYNDYREQNNEKIRIAFQSKADYKMHHIMFGGEYNREAQRYYSLEAMSLWTMMKRLTNFQLIELDKENPVYIYNNEGELDSVLYNRKYVESHQRYFDKRLREALGLPVNGVDYIMIDSYDKTNNTISYYDSNNHLQTIKVKDNLFDLNMFNPADLFNDGYSLVNYAGYDYTGKRINGKPDSYSFFNDYTIDALRPQYWSAYMQDEFQWKKLKVRVGLRLDVYDANRPVLKDPYTLYPAYTVDEALKKGELQFDKPDPVGSNFIVYTDRYYFPNEVTGFRKGDQWYNAEGRAIDDPAILDKGSGIIPYLKYPGEEYEIQGENWKPEMTFTDYKRAVNWLPQIDLDYALTKKLNIYVHYSTSTRNPGNGSEFLPYNYYYWNKVASSKIVSNPNLKPMRNEKFLAGLKGVLWKNLMGDVSFINIGITNYFQQKLYLGAYPVATYITYENADNKTSTNGFVCSLNFVNPYASGVFGGANFTKLFPDESDVSYWLTSDMVINSYLGYRIGNKNRHWGWLNAKALRGLSATLYYQYRKGTPYKHKNPSHVLVTDYTPAFNLVNLNVQKSFVIGKTAYINIYLTVENLISFKNVFKVYRDTGKPDDDGFLTDPANQSFINNQLDPDSYRYLYQQHLYNPEFYDIPRIWRFGIALKY